MAAHGEAVPLLNTPQLAFCNIPQENRASEPNPSPNESRNGRVGAAPGVRCECLLQLDTQFTRQQDRHLIYEQGGLSVQFNVNVCCCLFKCGNVWTLNTSLSLAPVITGC